MPIARFEMPDGRVARFEVPDGTTPEQAQQMMVSHFSAPQNTAHANPVKIGKESFADDLRAVLQEQDWGTRNIAGAGTALSNVWEGAKQFIGKGDQAKIDANKIIEQEAPVGSFAGNAALTAVPFGMAGNSIRAAGAVGAGFGALQPVQGDQSLGNIAQGKALNTAIGGAAGAGGQAVANKASSMLSNKAQALKELQKRNAPIDATIKEALDAGYVLPPGQVNPTFTNRTMESIAGKISTQQMASSKNAATTDRLGRIAAGLADNEPITPASLQAARNVIKKPYQDIADLGFQKHLDDLDALRTEARAAWKEYTMQGTRAALKDSKKFTSDAKALEQQIDTQLTALGKPELMNKFRAARAALAKNHNIEDALVEGGGTLDARKIAAMAQRGDPLTGELATIGNFANNFPKVTQPDKMIGTPDAHNLKSMLAILMAGGGGAAAGPAGMMAGALPFVTQPAARSLMFSKPMQQGLLSDYTVGMAPRVASGLLQYSPVAATAFGVPALSQ